MSPCDYRRGEFELGCKVISVSGQVGLLLDYRFCWLKYYWTSLCGNNRSACGCLSLGSGECENLCKRFVLYNNFLNLGILCWSDHDSFSWGALTSSNSKLPNLSSDALSSLCCLRSGWLRNEPVAMEGKVCLEGRRLLNLNLVEALPAVICHEGSEILWRDLGEFDLGLDWFLSRGKLGRYYFLGALFVLHHDRPWARTS